MPVGMAFGILASGIGFSVTQATICSATALAGAGQFIALSLMKAGEGLVGVLAATTIVNLRYVLFGATLSPYLRGLTAAQHALLAFTLTDETFAVNVSDRRHQLSTGTTMAAVGGVAWMGWVMGSLIGAAAGSLIGDPSRWGVDFAMPAMFTALFVALAEDRRHAAVGLLAGAVALALPWTASIGLAVPDAWFIVIASVGAATVATIVYPDGADRA